MHQPLLGLALILVPAVAVVIVLRQRRALRRTARYLLNFMWQRWWTVALIAFVEALLCVTFSFDVALAALTGILSTIGGILATWLLMRPALRIFPDVEFHVDEGDDAPRYAFRWRNQGFLDVFDARVQVWLNVPTGRTRGRTSIARIARLNITNAARPYLRAIRSWEQDGGQTSTFQLKDEWADWETDRLPPLDVPETHDLVTLMTELHATLHMTVTATSQVFGITRAIVQVFRIEDIKPRAR